MVITKQRSEEDEQFNTLESSRLQDSPLETRSISTSDVILVYTEWLLCDVLGQGQLGPRLLVTVLDLGPPVTSLLPEVECEAGGTSDGLEPVVRAGHHIATVGLASHEPEELSLSFVLAESLLDVLLTHLPLNSYIQFTSIFVLGIIICSAFLRG